MTTRVTLKIENGVADVRLNRPEKLNALDSTQSVNTHKAKVLKTKTKLAIGQLFT